MDSRYRPSLLLRNPHVQTILGSSRLRAVGIGRLLAGAVRRIVETETGARLMGYLNEPAGKAKGLAILLHGWEGSAASSYIRSLAGRLLKAGFRVFRMNLRDHGDTHHLNEGLFHGALTEETYQAVKIASNFAADLPSFLVGFSLGGNFALRVAARDADEPIAGLRHVVAVSPALDPLKATLAIDESFVYRRYFLKKWKRSLRRKERLFPHLYDFKSLMKHDTCMALTENIVPYFPQFRDYRHYFGHYTIKDSFFASLRTPVTVITSADDPIIDADEFQDLRPHPLLRIIVTTFGGHCGFFMRFPSPCLHEELMEDLFAREAEGRHDRAH